MAKKSVLGRGLGEILGEVREAYENNLGSHPAEILEIAIDEISPNPYQPRKNFDSSSLAELADSIKEYGLLQPILVYRDDDTYRLIAGERRLRASKMCGQTKIKAIIADLDLKNLRELALIENIQREDLNPIDLAKAYEELLSSHHLTHEELAKRLQKSRAQITNTLRLLNLDIEVQTLLLEGKITQGHAKVLVGLEAESQERIARSIVGQKLSVQETEKLVRGLKNKTHKKEELSPILEQELQEKITQILCQFNFNCKVSSEGKVVIWLKDSKQIEQFLRLIES